MTRQTLASLVALLALGVTFSLSGCMVYMPASRYVPAPPPPVTVAPMPCPAGYAWSPGYGCLPAPVPPTPAPAPVITRVASATLNLRTCPGTSCPAAATLVRGDEVRVLGYDSGWARVFVPSRNLEGWVSGRFLSDS